MHGRQKILVALAVAATASGPTLAGPNNGTVVNGNATIQGQGTSSVVINQTTQNAIINWQSFNIGNGERVQILMPNSSSAELDRVTGNLGPSQIDGSLTSNGRVFLVNPNGILFGQGAQINVGSLLATTNDIRNADFMAGRYNFSIPGNPSASIVNQGTITAKSGGFAALVAPGVRNTGTITAWLGRVGLASANTFALDLYGDRLIQLDVNDSIASQVIDVSTGQPLKSLVSNEGKLKANGGTVQLTAVAARQVVDSVINNSGVIEANSIGTHNGMIVLSAATADQKPAGAPTQTVTVSGKLSAAGRRAGTTGGTVAINGENIALNGATINASGNAGGGTVLIGGSGNGANGTSANASSANGNSAGASSANVSSDTFGSSASSGVTASSGNPNASFGVGLAANPAAGQTTNQVANQGASSTAQTVSNASSVTIDAATVIDASATVSGNGGKVTIWSDLATAFYGTILARGGAQGGNGGFVETSGGTLAFTGVVNTSAPNGKTGTWLLDPVDLTIDASAAATLNADLSGTSITLKTFASGLPSGPPGTTGNTNSNGTGNITIDAPISWNSNSTLTIDAYNAIIFNASINVMGAGGLALTAANNPLASAAPLISFNNGASVQFTGTPHSGQSLTIDNQPYTLLYSMSEVQDINNSSTNLSDNYALALPLIASSGTNWTPIGTNSDGTILNFGNGFNGAFQGLGNTISSLTINLPSTSNVGLFGYVGSAGLVQNVGMVGGSVTGMSNVGGLVGTNFGTVSQAYATSAVTGGSTSPVTAAGGLVGDNGSIILQSYATGSVNGQNGVGGLVGFNCCAGSASVIESYATGAVGTVTTTQAGGLVGINWGAVTQSYATSVVNGQSIVGGLIGSSLTGATVTQSYAAGDVTGSSLWTGGLIGQNAGSVAQSYALGAVTGVSFVGGLIGVNSGNVTQSYANGPVSGTSAVGALVGYNANFSSSGSGIGVVTDSYWNKTTAGAMPGVGAFDAGTTFSASGLTTSQLQAGLPNGFDATAWGSNSNINSGLPFLLWQLPNGTLVIDGYVYSDAGQTLVGSGITVNGLVNGVALSSLNGTVTTGANGSYNFVLTPGTISASGSQVLTYTTGSNGGAAYLQNATGSVHDLNIYEGYLNETSNASTLSAVTSGLATAIGGNTTVQTLVNGLQNRTLNATGSNFTIDQTISLTGGLIVNASGAITATSGINVGSFTLQNGNWSQVDASRPDFTAQNFTIAGGSFLRAAGGLGTADLPYQIFDIYGLQGIGSSSSLLAANYVLANNIDASGTANWNGHSGFVPIGNMTTNFTGSFNGNNNTISNLTINLPFPSFASVGLFGTVGVGGVVQNVGLVGGSVTGGLYVGELIGQNLGTVNNAYATGTVNGIGDPAFGLGAAAGDLVGLNGGTIANSHATGAVSVGIFGSAGGLVGVNGDCCDVNGNPISGASIINSYAQGAVFSSAIDVLLGGLVGFNYPLSVITNSQAYGNVTATANFQPTASNCIIGCPYGNVGGFVGENYGTINGASWATAPTGCSASFTCAMGKVSVGSEGQGGGFAGYNQGIINFAFAIGNVSGAAGQPSVGGAFNNQTQLGGFVGDNQGMISHAFAIGAVGTAGTPYLNVAGFAGSNEGTISNAFASGAVLAGDFSTAGGFVGGDGPNGPNANCPLCFVGDGFNNSAAISNSQALGNVTVGASSVAGGFASSSCGNNCSGGGTFVNVSASGAITAGHDSMVGGLVGVLGENSTLSNSSAQNTLVASTGPNSIVGGIVGVNFGTVSNTTSSAPVIGVGDSYIGGAAGINLGSLNNVTVDPAITGTGSDNFIGGLAGLNVGSINNSTALVAITSGPSSEVGGIAGVNGSYSNVTGTIPGSSFPNGTITNSSASGSGFSGNVGTQIPSFTPTLPAWLSTCTDGICTVLLNGSLQPNNPNPNPNPTPNQNTIPLENTLPTQQTTQLTQTVNFNNPNNTPPPVITLVEINNVTNGGNGGTGNTGTGGNGGSNGNGGNNGSLSSGKHGGNGAPPGVRLIDMPHMPLPPGTGLPPLNETRFLSNQLVLQFDTNNLTPQQISALAARFGLTVVAQQTIGMLGRTVYTFSISNGQSVRDLIRLIEATGLKVAVQPQYVYRPTQDGNAADQGDVGDPAQYIVEKLQLAAAHRISKGENVVIAVIDSSIDADQPDFVGGVIDRYDAGCGSTAPDAHGTGMAGAIASHVQLVGVAPRAKIIAICAFGGSDGVSGGGPEATSVKIIRGLDYAVQHGAKIVNMSFAGPYDPALAQALQVAREKGVLIVAAAGNAGAKSPPLYPGADPNVLAVTATDENDRLFAGANQGKYVALAAPGVNILVPAPNGGVQMTTGTSVATANVSGVAALLLAEKPSRTPEDIRALLVETAKHLGTKGINPQFGAGLVDPVRALEQVPPVAGGKSAAAAPAGRVQ